MTFSKVVNIGTGRDGAIFCKIEFTEGRLSISGVEGPKRNGDCRGACGQIVMHLKDEVQNITPAEGWTREAIAHFFDVWDRWHLNDCRAGCEHQRAAWDTTEKVEVVEYKLTSEALREQNEARKELERAIIEKGRVEASDDLRALLALPYFRRAAPDADSPASGRYEVYKRETKATGWVRPDEHPKGLLCKPCEVCGYKYGSTWLKEEVPAEVLEYLRSLPDTTVTPAWV